MSTNTNSVETNLINIIRGYSKKNPLLKTFAALAAIFVLFALFSPVNTKTGENVFLSYANIVNIFEATTAYSLGAFGMTLVLMVGCLDLSAGSNIAMCSAFLGIFLMDFGWPLPVAMIIVIVIAMVASLVNSIAIVKFNVPPFLATVCAGSIFQGVAYLVTEAKTVYIVNDTLPAIFGSTGPLFLGMPTLFWITMLFLVLMQVLMKKTKFGRQAQAVGGSENAAYSSGVNVKKTKILAFMIMGFLCAIIAFVLCGRLQSSSPQWGEGYQLNFVMAAVLGGTSFDGDGGNIIGTYLGALVMGTLTNGLNVLGVEYYTQTIIVAIIIFLVVLGSAYKSRKNKV